MNKQRIDELNEMVGFYFDALVSVSNDAGFEGDSILARVIEYGIASLSNGLPGSKMEHSIRLLRKRHKDYPKIAHAMHQLKKYQYVALIAQNACRGIWQEEPKVINWNLDLRAAEWQRVCLGLNVEITATPNPVNNFKYARDTGYTAFDNKLKEIESYEYLKLTA